MGGKRTKQILRKEERVKPLPENSPVSLRSHKDCRQSKKREEHCPQTGRAALGFSRGHCLHQLQGLFQTDMGHSGHLSARLGCPGLSGGSQGSSGKADAISMKVTLLDPSGVTATSHSSLGHCSDTSSNPESKEL